MIDPEPALRGSRGVETSRGGRSGADVWCCPQYFGPLNRTAVFQRGASRQVIIFCLVRFVVGTCELAAEDFLLRTRTTYFQRSYRTRDRHQSYLNLLHEPLRNYVVLSDHSAAIKLTYTLRKASLNKSTMLMYQGIKSSKNIIYSPIPCAPFAAVTPTLQFFHSTSQSAHPCPSAQPAICPVPAIRPSSSSPAG